MADSRSQIVHFVDALLNGGTNGLVPGSIEWTVNEYAIIRPSGYVSSYYKPDMLLSLMKYGAQDNTPVTRRITVTVDIEEWVPVDDTGERVVGS